MIPQTKLGNCEECGLFANLVVVFIRKKPVYVCGRCTKKFLGEFRITGWLFMFDLTISMRLIEKNMIMTVVEMGDKAEILLNN